MAEWELLGGGQSRKGDGRSIFSSRFVGDMDYEERGEALPSAIPPPEGNMAGFMILPEGKHGRHWFGIGSF